MRCIIYCPHWLRTIQLFVVKSAFYILTLAWGFRRCSFRLVGQCESLYSVERVTEQTPRFFVCIQNINQSNNTEGSCCSNGNGMRLEKWFISNLDDSQRIIIVQSIDEDIIVQGAAGSGKTNLAIHRALQAKNKGSYAIVIFTVALKRMIAYGMQALGLDKERIAYEWAWTHRGFDLTGDVFWEKGNRKCLECSNTEKGKQILSTLREFWSYKHNQCSSFSIPANLVVLKSLMAFFIKPFGFDQIDRYAQNRDIDSKEYGYMLRGALIGYTAFPKTFTDALYTNTDIYIPMDEYLTAIHKQVETQHPCD